MDTTQFVIIYRLRPLLLNGTLKDLTISDVIAFLNQESARLDKAPRRYRVNEVMSAVAGAGWSATLSFVDEANRQMIDSMAWIRSRCGGLKGPTHNYYYKHPSETIAREAALAAGFSEGEEHDSA